MPSTTLKVHPGFHVSDYIFVNHLYETVAKYMSLHKSRLKSPEFHLCGI